MNSKTSEIIYLGDESWREFDQGIDILSKKAFIK